MIYDTYSMEKAKRFCTVFLGFQNRWLVATTVDGSEIAVRDLP